MEEKKAFCNQHGVRLLPDGTCPVCSASKSNNQETGQKSIRKQPKGIDNDYLTVPTLNGIMSKILAAIGVNISGDDDDVYERGKSIVPDNTEANDKEIPLRQYDIAKLRTRLTFSRAEARLQITNKRVLIRAAGRSLVGRILLHQEFNINEIAGIEVRNTYNLSLLNYLGGLLFMGLFGSIGYGIALLFKRQPMLGEILTVIFGLCTVLGLIFLSFWFAKKKTRHRYYLERLIPLSITAGAFAAYMEMNSGMPLPLLISLASFMVLCCQVDIFFLVFVPNMLLEIKTKGGSCAVVLRRMSILAAIFGKDQRDTCGFKDIIPWTDTEKAIKEVGTIIDDLQTMGDAAIEKWKQ